MHLKTMYVCEKLSLKSGVKTHTPVVWLVAEDNQATRLAGSNEFTPMCKLSGRKLRDLVSHKHVLELDVNQADNATLRYGHLNARVLEHIVTRARFAHCLKSLHHRVDKPNTGTCLKLA